jgi:hypothetical protein
MPRPSRGRCRGGLKLEPLVGPALPKAVAALATGASPAKLMAVRGMAPMRPVEFLIAVYQLSFDADAAVKSAPRQRPRTLPDKIVLGPLGDPLPVQVLHFFAERLPPSRRQAIQKILLQPGHRRRNLRSARPSASMKAALKSSSRTKCACCAVRRWSRRFISTRTPACRRSAAPWSCARATGCAWTVSRPTPTWQPPSWPTPMPPRLRRPTRPSRPC